LLRRGLGFVQFGGGLHELGHPAVAQISASRQVFALYRTKFFAVPPPCGHGGSVPSESVDFKWDLGILGETAMTGKAIARLAVIALTGVFVFMAVPAFACTGDNCADSNGPVISKNSKKVRVAHRRHHRDDDDVASWGRPGSSSDTAKSQAKVEAKPDALPSDVADAHAQMSSDEIKTKPAAEAAILPTAETTTPSAQDPTVQVVNADELNDLDKAATDVAEPLPKLPPSIANSRAEIHVENASTWSQTSTIGKAFVAFGVMLTLASAARMFMA
jgi:hypothetical protein